MSGEQTETASEPISLRESLEKGFAAADAVPEIKPATIPEPAQQAAEAKSAEERARDEQGRFAPKEKAPEAAQDTQAQPETKAEAPKTDETTDAPAATGQEAPKEPIPPPAALSAAAKAKWSTLPPDIQAEWAKREADMVQGLQKQADNLKRFERMDAAIAPHRNYLAMNGLDEVSYVRSLVAADEELRGPNPIQAWLRIGQMYGIDPRQLGQPGQQPQGQAPQAQPNPAFQAMAQELAAVKGRLAQFETSTQEAQASQLQAQIDAFAREHVYYENVRPEMAALLRTPALQQLAETNPTEAMKQAYDRACRASPEVWPLLQAEQTRKQEEAQRAEATRRANEARQAAVSVTGSPTPGAQPARPSGPVSIRESLERAFGDAA